MSQRRLLGSFGRTKLSRVKGLVSPDINAWQRPTTWLSMPALTAADEQIALLVAVHNDSANKVSFQCSGNVSVNWGDGTTTTHTAGATASHSYSYTDPNIGATVSEGVYKTALITISPISGFHLTSFTLDVILPGDSQSMPSRIIEMMLSCPNMTSLSVTSASIVRQVTILSMGACGWDNLFSNSSLISFIGPVSNNGCTSAMSTFSNCSLLSYVSNFDLSNASSIDGMFSYCLSLPRITLTKVPAATSMISLFESCINLTYAYLGRFNSILSANSAFSTCTRLEYIYIESLGAVESLDHAFSGCSYLKKAPLFNTQTVVSWVGTFEDCHNLQEVPPYDTSSAVDMSYLFSSCRALRELPKLDTHNVASTNHMFYGCIALQKWSGLDLSMVADASFMFVYCTGMGGNLVLSLPSCTTIEGMFSQSTGWRSIVLNDTNNLQNAATAFSYALVRNVVISNTSQLTNTTHMFEHCPQLLAIPNLVFPTSGGSIGLAINDCKSLSTLPPIDVANVNNGINLSGNPNLGRIPIINIGTNIDVSYCNLGVAQLDEIYNNLINNTNETLFIKVFGNPGMSGSNMSISSNKGWTVLTA